MKKIVILTFLMLASLFGAVNSIAGTNGRPCHFDTECFPGYCVKNIGSIEGICAGGYGVFTSSDQCTNPTDK